MSKVTLQDLANLQNENTAVGTINDNSAAIEAGFDNTLSRDGTSPNQMNSSLDMNSNRILNLPAPISGTEPVRVMDSGPAIQVTAQAVAAAAAAAASATTANNAATLATTAASNASGYATAASNSAAAAAASAAGIATKANTAEAQAGTDDAKFMTPLKVKQAITYNLPNTLPSLPMRTRPVVTFGGDSTGMSNDNAVNLGAVNVKPDAYPKRVSRTSQGAMTWAMAYSGRRWTWHSEYDAGEGDSGKFVSGHNGAFASETHADMIQRLPRFLQRWKPQIHVIFSGINDLYDGCPASIVSYINGIDQQACDICRQNGCYPILVTLPGRGPKAYTYGQIPPISPNPGWPDVVHDGAPVIDPRYAYRLSINAGRKAIADNSGGTVFYCDVDDIFSNQVPGNDFGFWLPLMSRDGVHPSAVANQQVGLRLSAIMNPMINDPAPFIWPTDYSYFNRILNPDLLGTGGTLGTLCTGVVPTNWTVTNATQGGTPACSAVSSLINRGTHNAIQLTITMAGANLTETFEIRPDFTALNYPHENPDQQLFCEGTFSWGAFTGWREITPYISRREALDYSSPTTETTTFESKGCYTTFPETFPMWNAATTKVWMQTHGVNCVSGVRGFNPTFYVTVSNIGSPSGSATVILEDPRVMAKRTWYAYNS